MKVYALFESWHDSSDEWTNLKDVYADSKTALAVSDALENAKDDPDTSYIVIEMELK